VVAPGEVDVADADVEVGASVVVAAAVALDVRDGVLLAEESSPPHAVSRAPAATASITGATVVANLEVTKTSLLSSGHGN
jgi:hypothetical protein